MNYILPDNIDEILKNYHIEITTVDESKHLTPTQLKKLKKEFEQFVTENKSYFGDYEITINKPHSTGFIVDFFSWLNPGDFSLRNKKVIQSGIDKGEICDRCEQKLACLVLADDEEGRCATNEDIKNYVVESVVPNYKLFYPKDEVVNRLLKFGFEPKKISDIVIVKDVYYKDGITIYVP